MSNSVRDFTVIRRRAGVVDLITPKRPNVAGYRFQAIANWDGVFATIFTASIGCGYTDPSVDLTKLHSVNNNNHVRCVFNPTTFGLDDTNHFWMRFVPVSDAGVVGTAGPACLILPEDEFQAQVRVAIGGTAPSGAGVANSTILNLPFRMQDVVVRNNEAVGGRALMVALSPGGAERQVAPQETAEFREGTIGCLLVRGVAGTVAFSADFTHYLPLGS